jgi:hypothetical protein
MTDWSAGYMPRDGQLIPRTMGEALAAMVRTRWPHHTAKHVARAWELDDTTAKNLTKGHASERTLTKAIRAEGWSLLTALGHALTGQTHAEWEEQRLQKIIDEAEYAKESIRRLRTRAQLLAESSLDGDATGVLATDPEPRDAPGASRRRTG